MIIRRAKKDDKNAMLVSFKPLFGDWDYLPLVIDDWFRESSDILTFLAMDDDENNMPVAMAQAYEIEPGDWYLRGLRSNPNANSYQNGMAVTLLAKRIRREVLARGAEQVRYGTLEYFNESLRLASILGFREHFRLAHARHMMSSEISKTVVNEEVSIPDNPELIYKYLLDGTTLSPVDGYFFTWWDTRKLRLGHINDARSGNLLFQVGKGDEITGAAMFFHVPWQKYIVLSIMEGSSEALVALFNKAMERAEELGCKAFGLVHPSKEEMHRRQNLFGLHNHGDYTVQLVRSGM